MSEYVGYCRVSSADQAASGAGLAAQRTAIEVEIARRGWTLVEMVTDAGASGRRLRRPGLERALELCDTGEARGIVVSKLDRLSRSIVHFGHILERAKRGNWNLVALDFGLDLSSVQGELVGNVLMSVATWEARIVGERTREALAERKAEGVRIGRPPTLPDSVRSRIVHERAAGRSLTAIARALTDEAVPTAQGAPTWAASTVRKIALAGVASGDAAQRASARAQDGQLGEARTSRYRNAVAAGGAS